MRLNGVREKGDTMCQEVVERRSSSFSDPLYRRVDDVSSALELLRCRVISHHTGSSNPEGRRRGANPKHDRTCVIVDVTLYSTRPLPETPHPRKLYEVMAFVCFVECACGLWSHTSKIENRPRESTTSR